MITKVNILSIDKNDVIKVKELGSDVYSFFVNISTNPTQEWNNYFKMEWQKQQNLLMPQVLQGSAKIQIMLRLEEEPQVYIDELIKVISKCNDFVWQCNVQKAQRISEKRNKESNYQEDIELLKEKIEKMSLT